MKAWAKQLMVSLWLAGAMGAVASEVVCRVEMDNAVVLAGVRKTAVVKVTLDAPVAPKQEKRPPVNLTIVLDRSGSMSGSKLSKACEAAITALRRLEADDLFSLVTYDHEVTTVVPAQSAANSEWIEGRIRSIVSGGNTALFAGVSQGASEVRKHLDGKYVNRILLLSDGIANVGPSSPSELGRLATAFRKEGISVTTIGVGTDYNEDLMAQVAQNSDGNNYFVESSVDLPRIFNAELGDVLSVVASKVTLEVEFPEGIRPVRILGRDGRVGRNSVELTLNQLYGGQEKFALIEVELPEGVEGEVRKVAAARCHYQDMLSNQPASSAGQATVAYSGSAKTVRNNVNLDVSNDYYFNTAAEAQEQAIAAADNADFDGAVQVLTYNAGLLDDYAKGNDQPALEAQAEKLRQQADSIQSQGALDSVSRKRMRSSSFGIITGQKTAPVVVPEAEEDED